MSQIIHLVPKLPPAICGMGDYATLVGGKIELLQQDVRCGYVACGFAAENKSAGGPGRRSLGESRDAERLWCAVREVADELAGGQVDRVSLVVHYSGYGYDRGGAPSWFAAAFERRPPQLSGARVVSMFHELYATGWPWQRAFWKSAQQRSVAVRMARLSDILVTNREQSARWLERVTGRAVGSIPNLPVISNIGEPAEVVPWSARADHAVTFGGARFKRSFLVGRGARATAALCRKLDIRRIISIGQRAEVDQAAFRPSGVDVTHLGFLAAQDASQHFRSARISFVDYYDGYLAKSSVLAAAAAHGAPPIFPIRGTNSDDLKFGEHVWDLRSGLNSNHDDTCARLSSISRSVRTWYDGHSLERHARLLAGACGLNTAAVG